VVYFYVTARHNVPCNHLPLPIVETTERMATRGPKKESEKTEQEKAERKLRSQVRQAAAESGMLPHEILLQAARGEVFRIKQLKIVYYGSGPNKGEEKSREWVDVDYHPSYQERIDAAKSAAPYFAPRLATQIMQIGDKTPEALAEVFKQLAEKLPS